jgi:hypothetical protein
MLKLYETDVIIIIIIIIIRKIITSRCNGSYTTADEVSKYQI